MLGLICVYQIIVYFIGIIIFFQGLKESFGKESNLNLAITSLILIAFSVYSIYINSVLLLRKKYFDRFLNINIWLNVL